MILSFMQNWEDGFPTYFVEKIWQAIENEIVPSNYSERYNSLEQWQRDSKKFFNSSIEKQLPKNHTIRFMTPEKFERWKKWEQEKKNIQFVINRRTPNQFQFAEAPLKFVQEVFFNYEFTAPDKQLKEEGKSSIESMKIDENILKTTQAIKFMKNDGFEGVTSFDNYFTLDRVCQNIEKGKTKIALIGWAGEKY